jgi:hypothetical protein
VVPNDFLARQPAAAGEQVIAVAGQEIVELAEDNLQPVPLQLQVADDLRVEQANGVAGGAVAEAGQELVGDGRAADIGRRLQDGDLQPLPGQIISAGQAVVASADDDRVV